MLAGTPPAASDHPTKRTCASACKTAAHQCGADVPPSRYAAVLRFEYGGIQSPSPSEPPQTVFCALILLPAAHW